jgi:hypothetical protein
MSTLAQLNTRVQARLSMASGTGVQTYAEDRISEMIQYRFDTLFEMRWWSQFFTFATYTLDGTLGVVTTDLTDLIKRYDDLAVIYVTDSNKPLTEVTMTKRNVLLLAGTTPIQFSGLGPTDANKTSRVFQIWPKASTGTIEVGFRTKPDTFAPSDVVDFDDQALILGATFDYLEDDGANPNATAKFERMYRDRETQLLRNYDSGPISLDPSAALPQTFGFTALT